MKRLCTLFVICLTLSCWLSVADAQTVRMPDANLAAAVRNTLDLGPNARITKQAMQSLTVLIAGESEISDLTGLEHATQLTGLHLYDNQIRNVSPLAELTKLKELSLSGNQISNIRPLSGLTQLELLHLSANKINNAGVRLLTPLKQLRELALAWNQIGNITPLAKLTKLEGLWLNHNKIRDVSPLAKLVNLQALYLAENPIQDFSPLTSLTNLTDVDFLLSEAEPIIEVGEEPVEEAVEEAVEEPFPSAGPKIEGPWLWMIIPTGQKGGRAAAISGKDYLAAASDGAVTEKQIAKNGVKGGALVGNRAWTSGKLAPTGDNNIGEMVNAIGLGSGDIDYHVAYGSIALNSPRKQKTTMYVGSDDAVKVWLNGKLVHKNPVDRGADNYLEVLPVTLKKGKNILLVAVYEEEVAWSGFFGFKKDAVYRVVGETPAGPKIEGPWLWMTVPTRLKKYTKSALRKDLLAAASKGAVTENQIAKRGATAGNRVGKKAWTPGKLSPTSGDNINEVMNAIGLGRGTIDSHVAYGSIILDVPRKQKTRMYAGSDDNHKVWLNGKLVHKQLDWDWKHDYQGSFPVTLKKGKNVLLVAVENGQGSWSGYFGFESDTMYSIFVKPTAAAPLNSSVASSQTTIPETTGLLANYPNPFNPETWIPYQLAAPADVQITIYDTRGALVRRLELGHQAAGSYTSRSRAAYWAGRNSQGERVASGIYFYQFQAGNVSSLRKMLILK